VREAADFPFVISHFGAFSAPAGWWTGMEIMRIRPIEARDAKVAAILCTQLGYPTDEAAVLERMRQIAGDAHRAVLVACLDDVVAGDRSERRVPPAVGAGGLIGGLVVAESARGRGSAAALQGCGGLGSGAGCYPAASAIECHPGARACFLSARRVCASEDSAVFEKIL